jgi:hypothetical protein
MPSFQVEHFQRADVVGESATLRIDGRWISAQPEVVSDPVLLIRNGGDLARIEPVAGSETHIIATPGGEPWGVRFAVPSAALGGEQIGYALEIAGGLAFALPEPQQGEPQYRSPAPTEHGSTTPPAADHDFEALREAVRELQSRLDSERRARRAAEKQLAQATPDSDRLRQLEVMIGELEAHVRALGTSDAGDRVKQLELQLSEAAQERSVLEQRIGEAEHEGKTLQAALDSTREAYAELQSETAALADELRASKHALQLEAQERKRAQDRVAQLRDELADVARQVGEGAGYSAPVEEGPADRLKAPATDASRPETASDGPGESREAPPVGGSGKYKALLILLVLVIAAVLSLEATDVIQAPPLNP